jgi:hypothetical protein
VIPTNPALEPNKALTTGRQMPGGGTGAATFRYQLLTNKADVASGGVIRLRSTGTAGVGNRTVSRTLTANLRPGSFLNYIYHTDLENLDPVLWTTNTTQIANCSKYWWNGRSSASCSEITFPPSDVINGPLHSNDALSVGDTSLAVTFTNARTETSYAPSSGKPWRGTATPRGTAPYVAPIVQIPASNDELKKVAANIAQAEGCLYTGATKITFNGTTMTVLSPNTTAAPARCYNSSSVTSRNTAQTVTIPRVIYVDDYAGSCGNGGTAKNTGLGYPLGPPGSTEYVGTGDRVWSGSYRGPVYDCTDGTAYIAGTIDTAVTVGTAQDIVVTANLSYQDSSASSTDVLGLIPGHFAWVYHPVQLSGSTYTNMLPTPVTRIDAAILAVKDSFIVQNYDLGPPISTITTNRLNVTGAIAQKFRGRVAGNLSSSDGSVSAGYVKNYVYDERFQRGVQPPYFLKPVSAPWEVRRVSDSPVP